jgi:aerobic carbon-monoxide dehydrogenase medium subunit
MKPAPFHYHDPTSIDEAAALLGSLENAKLLAGGQSLMAMMNMRYVQPDHIIDLNGVSGLAYIEDHGDDLVIGAMTRQRDLEFSDLVRARCPILHEAILHVGHRQTRNRGTIGGSLCHLDPAAELAAIAALHDATVTVKSAGAARQAVFRDFVLGFMTPALEPTELLASVRIPLWPARHGYAFLEFARRHGDFAIASAAALLTADDRGHLDRVALVIGGVAVAPVRISEAEELKGKLPAEDVFRSVAGACRTIDVLDDIHAPAAYRRQLAETLAFRALKLAADRLQRKGQP